MERFTVNPNQYYDFVVKPSFADIVNGPQNNTLGEWSIMDDVASKRRIVDILGSRNILKRRDASCNIVFSPVGKAAIREIETDKIYGATKHCENEFYQGCLEDFQNKSPKFREYIMKFFQDAIAVDIASNAYFGDITRASDSTGVWNWNTFDGVFTHIAKYIADGAIKSAQTSTLKSGAITPQDAYNYLDWAYENQDLFLAHLPDNMKAFYVTKTIHKAYGDYIRSTGGAYNVQLLQNGLQQLYFNNIPVLVEPTWDPIMTALNSGTAAHAVVLTIRGNFVFATDKNYGEATPDGVKSLMVWYSYDELSWKYANFMKAGTGIAYPEHLVIGMTPF